MTTYNNIRYLIVDDDEILHHLFDYGFFSSNKNDLIIHAKKLLEKIMEAHILKLKYENQTKEIQDMVNKRIRLEEELKNLGLVRGIVDKFGSYKSLQKNCELILFFQKKDRHRARRAEVIKYFMDKGWKKSTIENHIRTLSKNNILIKGDLPGEYILNKDQGLDMDILTKWILGSEIYEMVKHSWKNKEFS